MFLFGKLPVEIQQELTMANKEESSPEEIKTYLMRKYQYQQYVAPPTAIQPFNAVTSSAPATITTTKPTTTTTTTQPTERKRFEGQCFYCGKTGHRKTECRARQRDEANGIKKEDAIPMKKAADPDKPKYNPKLVCRFVATPDTQPEIADDAFPRKAALHMERFHTQRIHRTTTRLDDKI